MQPSTSSEMAFVLAAMRRDGGASAARAAAAESITDWPALMALAGRREVPWWVWRALPATGVPSDVRVALTTQMREQAVAALASTRELLTLVDALERAGVGVVAYKGPALAADVHGDISARAFTDLDLLIAERDRDHARRALLALGYCPPDGYTARESRFYSAWEGVLHFTRAGAGWPVELHWRVQAPRYGGPQDPAGIVARARRIDVGGGTVPVPAVAEQAVLLAVHGVKHAWTSLLWVADFANAVSRDAFDWDAFDAIAASWRVERAVNDALLVAHELVAASVPPQRLARARTDAAAVRLAGEAVQGLASDAERPNAGRDSTATYDLQWLSGARAKVRYLSLAAALPTPQERHAARLPDALLPLAYPVRAWRLLQHAVRRRA